MKIHIPIALFMLTACSPKPQNTATACFKGKLVKRGICGQRVIQMMGEPVETVIIANRWTDSLSGKIYENVFTVANPCDFPAGIREGDEFNFSLAATPASGCATCYAYTPVPKEKNNIATGCKP